MVLAGIVVSAGLIVLPLLPAIHPADHLWWEWLNNHPWVSVVGLAVAGAHATIVAEYV